MGFEPTINAGMQNQCSWPLCHSPIKIFCLSVKIVTNSSFLQEELLCLFSRSRITRRCYVRNSQKIFFSARTRTQTTRTRILGATCLHHREVISGREDSNLRWMLGPKPSGIAASRLPVQMKAPEGSWTLASALARPRTSRYTTGTYFIGHLWFEQRPPPYQSG